MTEPVHEQTLETCDTMEFGKGGLVDFETQGNICLVATPSGGLTLCGIKFMERGFYRRGGTSGPSVTHYPCKTCEAVADNRGLTPTGLHAGLFKEASHA